MNNIHIEQMLKLLMICFNKEKKGNSDNEEHSMQHMYMYLIIC